MPKFLPPLLERRVVLTVLSLFVAVAYFGWRAGWLYGLAIVLLLVCYQVGRYVATRRCGLRPNGVVFIPFLGAWSAGGDVPQNAAIDAYISCGGPAAMALAGMGLFWASEFLHSPLLLSIAWLAFFLTLVNLIPLPIFDGGRILAVVSPALWLLGVPLVGALFVWSHSIVPLLLGFICLPSLILAWRHLLGAPMPVPEFLPEDFYTVPGALRVRYGLLYVGTTAFFLIMAYELRAGM